MATRQIPWARIFAEGVAIVVSILLAFGIQAWWEGRQAREEEQALLADLLEDFRSNESPLDERIDQHRRMAAATEAVLRIVAASDGPEIAVPDSLLVGVLSLSSYDATLGALAEAQNSGRMGLLQNRKLRSLLGAWPGRLADALEEQEAATFLQRNRFPEVLGNYVSVADLASANVAFLRGSPSGLGSASRDVPVSPALENYLTSRRRALSRSADELSGLRAKVDSIVQLLEADLRR